MQERKRVGRRLSESCGDEKRKAECKERVGGARKDKMYMGKDKTLTRGMKGNRRERRKRSNEQKRGTFGGGRVLGRLKMVEEV